MGRPRVHDKNLPANVRRKHGAYYYVRAGKWTRLGSTLSEALRAYAAMMRAESVGGAPRSINELLDKFLVEEVAKKRPKTVEMYTRCVAHLRGPLVEFGVDDLEADDATALFRHIAKERGGTTANQCRATLSAAFSFAIERGLAKRNPVKDTKRIKVPTRTRYLEHAELQKLAEAGSPAVRAVILVAYATAQRISDVLQLAVEQQDKDFVTLRQLKTGHRVKLRRNEALTAALKEAKELSTGALWRDDAKPATIIFNRLGKPYTLDGFEKLWQRARAKAGVKDAHIHDIRATALTDAEEIGLDAQKLAGHASRVTTERYIKKRKAFIATPLPAVPTAMAVGARKTPRRPKRQVSGRV